MIVGVKKIKQDIRKKSKIFIKLKNIYIEGLFEKNVANVKLAFSLMF